MNDQPIEIGKFRLSWSLTDGNETEVPIQYNLLVKLRRALRCWMDE
jgi:hypothetical protein